MSLSEKTDDLPDPATAKHDSDAAVPAAKARGSLIERWDALERKNATRQPAVQNAAEPRAAAGAAPTAAGEQSAANSAASAAAPSTLSKPVAPFRGTPAPSAGAPRREDEDEPLLQDVASDDDFGPDQAASQPAPEERHPRPVTRRSGYTQVSFNMSYGGQRPSEDPAAAKQDADTGAPGNAQRPPASVAPGHKPAAQSRVAATAPDSGSSEDSHAAALVATGADAELEEIAIRAPGEEVAPAPQRPEQSEPAAKAAATGPVSETPATATPTSAGASRQDVPPSHDAPSSHDLATTAPPSYEGGIATDHQLQTSADSTALSKSPAIPPVDDELHEIRYGRSIFTGILLLLIGVGGFIAWAALAPISSGVMAAGSIKLEGERKVVQHLEGGIIQDLLVAEGDPVKAGQVLVRLDGSRANAVLEVQMSDYLSQLARRSRLLSERRGLETVEFDPEILARADDPRVAELMETERALFADRLASHRDQLNIFASWAEGHKREITGLRAQKTASEKQLVHINDELQSVQTLYEKGIVAKTRLLELKRTAAGLTGQSGALTAEISRAEQKIGEAELRAVSLQNERAQEISDALTAVENGIRRLKEQLPAQRDVVERLEIKAPSDGRVVNLRFHTVGGVINASTPILDIVPEDARLVIEARVAPIDVDILKPGMDAQITLSAYSQRTTPPVPGKLLQISADRIDESNGDSYYKAMVDIDRDALAALPEVKLYPGMPAQVQFVGGERTPMDYLLAPIEAGLRNAWLEE